MEKEICYILVGKRIGRFYFGRMVKKTIGNSNSVEFNWQWVLNREETKGDVIGFWHTHPRQISEPSVSERDFKTMNAWFSCLGKILLCIIVNSEGFYRGFSISLYDKEPGHSTIWYRLPRIFHFCRLFGAITI